MKSVQNSTEIKTLVNQKQNEIPKDNFSSSSNRYLRKFNVPDFSTTTTTTTITTSSSPSHFPTTSSLSSFGSISSNSSMEKEYSNNDTNKKTARAASINLSPKTRRQNPQYVVASPMHSLPIPSSATISSNSIAPSTSPTPSSSTPSTSSTPSISSTIPTVSNNVMKLRKRIFFKSQRKGEISEQENKCFECQEIIGIGMFSQIRYCEYYAKYFCKNCHTKKKFIIPSKILENWDTKLYPNYFIILIYL
jgi:hypothetical protein